MQFGDITHLGMNNIQESSEGTTMNVFTVMFSPMFECPFILRTRDMFAYIF